MQLIATLLDRKFFLHKKEIFLLGDWCNSDFDFLEGNAPEVLPPHWGDRNKIKKDYNYLCNVYENSLCELSSILNEYHDLNYPKSFWRIILGPWLLTYVAVIWDRYESVRLAVENNSISCVATFKSSFDLVPKDYQESMAFMTDHSWNQATIADIVQAFYQKIQVIRPEEFSPEAPPIPKIQSRGLGSAFNFIDGLISKIGGQQDIVIYKGYFSLKDHALLSLILKQLPRAYKEFNKRVSIPEANLEIRNKYSSVEPSGSKFANFLKSRIIRDIPVSYLEGLPSLISEAGKINLKPKVILTANAHFGNELFKVWSAIQILNGDTKLLISDHGGSIRSEMSCFSHEEKISYRKIVWGKETQSKHVRLPAQKLSGVECRSHTGDYCTIIGLEFPCYTYRCQSGPNSSLIIKDFQQKINFIKALAPNIYNKVKVKPYPNKGWNLRKKYEETLGKEKIEIAHNLRSSFESAKLIICTYPQTTFLEAMASGKPTILLYTREYWENEMVFEPLVEKLLEVGIIFSDSRFAAEHVNRIWSDPLKWWEDSKTTDARKMFREFCGSYCKGEVTSKWATFLRSVSESPTQSHSV